MAGDGGPHGDLGGLAVPDLADGDDVRILPQDGAETVCEGHAGLFVDLGLVHAVDVIFYRILQRHQVDLGGVDLPDHGVHGGGFTASGRACQQNYAVWAAKQGLVLAQIRSGQADVLFGKQLGVLIQKTDDHLLAVNGGDGGHTQV